MRNVTTPRTLSECQFVTGYSEAPLRPLTFRSRLANWSLALAIGVGLGLYLTGWWAS